MSSPALSNGPLRFVLVHGASHGAWCWDRLIPELTALGHQAVAVDLPGNAARPTEAATLTSYRDAVLEHLTGSEVLVGHSMGSAVVSVVADARPDLVGHLTLLGGPLPVDGKPLSYQSTAPSVGGTQQAVDADEASAERTMKLTDDGSAFYWDRDGARETFFHDCDEATVEWAAARLVPQPLAPVLEPVTLSRLAGVDLPRSYVVCLEDRAFPTRVCRQQAARLGVEPLTIATSHSPFLSRPKELAALLVHATTTTPLRAIDIGEGS